MDAERAQAVVKSRGQLVCYRGFRRETVSFKVQKAEQVLLGVKELFAPWRRWLCRRPILGDERRNGGVGVIEELGEDRKIVVREALGVVPLLALFIRAGDGDAIEDAFGGWVPPDGDLEAPVAQVLDRNIACFSF